MKFFKEEDFIKTDKQCMCQELPNELAFRANAKLEKEGKVVYQEAYASGQYARWIERDGNHSMLQAKALLINIEPIEACKHSKEKVRHIVEKIDNYRYGSVFECECGAKVEPVEFKEVT